MYDQTRQYRCTIIRGKAQKDMDNLLPAYATVLNDICPCEKADFQKAFDEAFSKYLPNGISQKTLDNHRTEISGKLFGMYFCADDGYIYTSERTQKYFADSDAPAFFKDICYKMQFPNGTQKINTVLERIENGIKIRPNAFLLKVLQIADSKNIFLSKQEIGYYILNSLDVLQGKATPIEVVDAIILDRKRNIKRTIHSPGKGSSYDWQHINEQINMLELANLVIICDNIVKLNLKELSAIEKFTADATAEPSFDVYSYDLSTKEAREQFYFDWDVYFGSLSDKAESFSTDIASLIDIADADAEEDGEADAEEDGESEEGSDNTTVIGDEGEKYVLAYEKKRVSNFNSRLVNKVIHLGKTKGLGFDIQSVIAEPGEYAEFVKYIEVKSTKRITAPDINDVLWFDTINLTRNEWIAAKQHGSFYHIYRVYFTREQIIIFIISDINQKDKDGIINAVPTMYRIDFRNDAVNQVIVNGEVQNV